MTQSIKRDYMWTCADRKVHQGTMMTAQIHSPAITGETDVWGLRPLLLTGFVMMNIGAAEDVGVFLEICGDIQKACHVWRMRVKIFLYASYI